MADTFNRSRLAILSRIIQGATSKSCSGQTFAGSVAFIDDDPKPGDLVRIEAAEPSKWYLSWFVEMLDKRWNKCVLRSIDDMESCVWLNIGVSVFDRSEVQTHWHWTDRQWALWDRWRIPDRQEPPDWVRPCMPVFDGEKVTLSTRSKFNLKPDDAQSKTFENWKKVTRKDMQEFYYSVVNRPGP